MAGRSASLLLAMASVLCVVGFASASPKVAIRTSQVTYWSLSPQVGLTASVTGAPEASNIRFRIVDPLSGKVYAKGNRPLDAQDMASIQLRIKVLDSMGLLAVAELRDSTGLVVARASRPFDLSNDSRRNFRYGTTAFGTVTIAKGHNFPWPRMEDAAPTKEQSFESAYDCYQNVLNMMICEDRGHWTCWEEYGKTSWPWYLYTSDAVTIYYDKLKWLCEKCNESGILPQTHVDFQWYGSALMKDTHPWIEVGTDGKARFVGGYRAWYMKRDDPDWHRPLTSEERKLMSADPHGATNWIEFMGYELDTVQKHFSLGSFWLDNGCSFDSSAPYLLPELRRSVKARRPEFVFMTNCGSSYPFKNSGFSDVFWSEEDAQPTMDKMIAHMRKMMERPREPGATVYWAGAHPKTDGMTLADINNRKEYTFLYRQFLFELISMDADLVGAGNEPRRHDVRWVRFRDAYSDHERTWGFQTLYNHLYNSRDIVQMDAIPLVSIQGTDASFNDDVRSDTVHVRMTSRPSTGQLILHLFNYMGSTLETVSERKHPTRQDSVLVRVRMSSRGKYVVKILSPDFLGFDDVREQSVETGADGTIVFPVPLDIYSLVVIDAGIH